MPNYQRLRIKLYRNRLFCSCFFFVHSSQRMENQLSRFKCAYICSFQMYARQFALNLCMGGFSTTHTFGFDTFWILSMWKYKLKCRLMYGMSLKYARSHSCALCILLLLLLLLQFAAADFFVNFASVCRLHSCNFITQFDWYAKTWLLLLVASISYMLMACYSDAQVQRIHCVCAAMSIFDDFPVAIHNKPCNIEYTWFGLDCRSDNWFQYIQRLGSYTNICKAICRAKLIRWHLWNQI